MTRTPLAVVKARRRREALTPVKRWTAQRKLDWPSECREPLRR